MSTMLGGKNHFTRRRHVRYATRLPSPTSSTLHLANLSGGELATQNTSQTLRATPRSSISTHLESSTHHHRSYPSQSHPFIMPTAIKRRKLSTAPKNATSRSQHIGAFTQVSKGNSITTKTVIEKTTNIDSITITLPQVEKSSAAGAKRKLSDIEEDEVASEALSQVASVSKTDRLSKTLSRTRSQLIPKTPRKSTINSTVNIAVDTPTKGVRSLFDRFLLTTPTRSPLKHEPSHTPLLDLNTPPSSQELPTEILDLINLHAAFLTALSLHYAHNGINTPADLRMLRPNVARAWGKRSVTLEDIRRTIGVLNTSILERKKKDNTPQLTLSDYGHGKICIEISISAGKPGTIIARPVNENLLNEIFSGGLKSSWEASLSEIMDMTKFIDTLPLEPITTCSSLLKISPMLAKGQRRLEDFKMGITLAKEQEKAKAVEAEIAYTTGATTTGAKPTLLERLRAKQLEKKNQPPPPTKAELARKAAMQKIEEVASVLVHLSTSSSVGQTRISFTLPTVLGKLRDSLKTPISKAEGETCVRLLAAEIAPEWVKMVKMGKLEALVVNRDERPTESSILERVKNLC